MNNVISSLIDLAYNRQHNRILRLTFPHNDGPSSEFLVNKLEASESLSRDFEFTVELLSDDASMSLKDMQGKLLSIQLVCGDGNLRYFTGYVFQFRRKRSDGSLSYYEAQLGPWLKFLSLRKDNYLFHGKTLAEQTDSILNDYAPHAKWEWRVVGEDLPFTDACQFDETDHNYLSRRWEAAGLLYWYEHTETGHQLVIANDSTRAPAIDGDSAVRFHAAGGQAEEDAIDLWTPVREIAPSSVALSGFDFKNPLPSSLIVPTLGQQGNVPKIESYEYVGAYGFKDFNDGDNFGKLRMEEMEAACRYFEGEGNNRRLAPGRYFQLTDHFNHGPYTANGKPGNDEFLVLTVHHIANNNYLPKNNAEPTYRNTFTCMRKNVPWRPGRNFNSNSTKILAPQTATVVGPTGPDSIYTDEYGRVRVQFHWDRLGNKDESSSAWLRVASPWAGAELGAASIPRVGSEVIVQWLDGNPDRPIITGSVFNERNMPPWSVPTQQSLMGLRSRELAPERGNSAGGRSNHLVLDDTNGKIQAQLKSDHRCSQLSLGHIGRIDDTTGRKDDRGEGFELATEAKGVLRAGQGMLVTTELRRQAAGHTTDMGETQARLRDGAALHRQLADDAIAHGAQKEDGDQQAASEAHRTQNDALRGEGNQNEFAAPHLVLSSPAGIAASTPHSTHLHSGEHVTATAGGHLSLAAGKSLFASVAEKISFFVSKAGMKLFAARGKIDIQAQSDDIDIIADRVLKLISAKDRIEITAAKEILLNAGGSYIRIDAKGIEHGTGGLWASYAGQHKLEGPKNLAAVNQATFEKATPKKFSQQVFVDAALWNLPEGSSNFKYKFYSRTNQLLGAGRIDGAGMSAPLFTDGTEPLRVEIDTNGGKWEQLVFDRPDGIAAPEGAPTVVFDYQNDGIDEASIDGADAPPTQA